MKSEKEKFMTLALKEADKAEKKEEVPIGCVIVKDGKVVARAHNLKQTKRLATAHAEVLAIEQAAKTLKNRRLLDCTLYVTLEPCPICAGAVMTAGLKRLVYGAFDDKNGACASVAALFDEKFTHIPMVRSRVLKERCGEILSEFFKDKR